MKLYLNIPIKKKSKIYISIIAVTFLVLKTFNYYSNYQTVKKISKSGGMFNYLDKAIWFKDNQTIFQDKMVQTLVFKLNHLESYNNQPLSLKDVNKLIRLDALIVNGNGTIINFQKAVSKKNLLYSSIKNCQQNEPNSTLCISNPYLKFLSLQYCDIDNITFCRDLNLEVLTLFDLRIKSLKGLEFLIKLKKLKLGEIGLIDLSPLENCTELEELNLQGCDVKDFSPLTKLRKLKKLTVSLYEDFEFLREMKNLKELNIKICSPIVDQKEYLLTTNRVIASTEKIKEIREWLPNCKVNYIPFTFSW